MKLPKLKIPKIDFNPAKIFVKGRNFKYGTNAVIITFLLLGIIWFASYIIDKHPVKYDATANKQFSLSAQTKSILGNLKTKVNAVAFVKKGSLQQRYISDMLKDFSQRSTNFTFEITDPEADPGRANKYNIRSYNTVVFECGAKKKGVEDKDIFITNYNDREGGMEFAGENAFINAILAITENRQKSIFFTEGHKEKDIDDEEKREGISEVRKTLTGENYIVKKLSIMKEGRIPDDCDILVVAGPKSLFIDKEVELIKNYLLKGGKAIFLFEPETKANLDSLLEYWNLKLDDDIILDPSQCFSIPPIIYRPDTPMPTYKNHPITEPLAKSNVVSLFPTVRSISNAGKKIENRNITKEDLLTTSPGGWGETDFKNQKAKFDKDKDKEGPLTFAVAISEFVKEEKKGENKDEPVKLNQLMFVVVGDSDFITNGQMGIPGNKDFFINSINWALKEGAKIAVRPVKADIRKLTLTKGQSALMFYTTFIITPLLVIAAGIVVWLRRRAK